MSVDDLIEAVRGNDGKEVLRLTDEEHIDVNRRNQVIIFLSFLDDLGLVEQDGMTAFMWASMERNLNMMRLLLERGANPLIKTRVCIFLFPLY